MLIWTIIFFVVAAVVKIDLQEGTLPLASFYKEPCTETTTSYQTVQVKIAEHDTIHSILATTPMETEMSFSERLALFFQYNPHLQKQSLRAGESVTIPIKRIKQCQNT